MQFRSLIFPAPNPPSYSHDKLLGELLYIPRNFQEVDTAQQLKHMASQQISVSACFQDNHAVKGYQQRTDAYTSSAESFGIDASQFD